MMAVMMKMNNDERTLIRESMMPMCYSLIKAPCEMV